MLKTLFDRRWFHPLLLLVWIAIGAVLRFTQLTGKPPWTDEFATLVFSLGNSFQTVPLDQAISLDTLLQPLKPNPFIGASEVIHRLTTEDHHPPLYFVLVHWWMQLFPNSGEYISLWAARSLPALFGVASIPAVYGLGWLAFRSRLVAQLAAAMMAVSPYGIFLTQEARHYALGILWVIASLGCLVVAVQHLQRRKLLPIGVVLCWVVVNALGMATHYFFSLTLCAEALVLGGLWILRSRLALRLGKVFPIPQTPCPLPHALWWRIYAVAAGTLVGCLVWVPIWQMSHDSQMTQWIKNSNPTFLSFISPIFQALASWITMLALLPVESPALFVVIASGAVMLIFFIWALPILYRGIQAQMKQPDSCIATGVLGGFVVGAIAIFFGITYFLGIDLTRGARYNFVYFPAVIVLFGAALASRWKGSETRSFELLHQGNSKSHIQVRDWQLGTKDWEGDTQKGKRGEVESEEYPSSPVRSVPVSSSSVPSPQSSVHRHHSQPLRTSGKTAVAMIWLIGLLSGITVVSNLGYQKYYRPDLLVPVIQQASKTSVLIATTHNTLVQTGEMMGLAWEFNRSATAQTSPKTPKFLLAHQPQAECVSAEGTTCRASIALKNAIAKLPRPLDVWLVNFKASIGPEPPNCFAEDISQYQSSVNGYTARLYHCLADNSQASR
ncbi:MAG: glycosyltransferase family 39 protein [Cyanobacteriota bacterium]